MPAPIANGVNVQRVSRQTHELRREALPIAEDVAPVLRGDGQDGGKIGLRLVPLVEGRCDDLFAEFFGRFHGRILRPEELLVNRLIGVDSHSA